MSTNGGPVLDAQNISKVFGGLVAVNDVSFSVPERGIVSLIGPNGAGKTTFFNCLTGLYRPTTGRVTFAGKDITAKRPDLVTRAGIARTFQNIKLFRTMNAIENVQVGMHSRLRSRLSGILRGFCVRRLGLCVAGTWRLRLCHITRQGRAHEKTKTSRSSDHGISRITCADYYFSRTAKPKCVSHHPSKERFSA